MSVVVRQAPAGHLAWLAQRAHIHVLPGLIAIEAVKDGGQIVAMVGYEPHFPRACMMHVALEYPTALRHVLKTGFHLAFDAHPHGLGCVEVFAPVRDDNGDSLALLRNPKFGWRELFHGQDWLGNGLGIVWFGMRRGDCRFLEN